uniref:Uncharacterized protein n=1 Tax=Caenorhabditis japonica TaxID=281687 RepID=A0A8R1HV31_CAEJA
MFPSSIPKNFVHHLQILLNLSIFSPFIVFLVPQCSKKKPVEDTVDSEEEEESEVEKPSEKEKQTRVISKEAARRKARAAIKTRKRLPNSPNNIRPPKNRARLADTHDPNYQTLAGLNNDCFEVKGTGKPGGGGKKGAFQRKNGPKPPPPGSKPGMVGSNDPNYQTLAGVEDVFASKEKCGMGSKEKHGKKYGRQGSNENSGRPKAPKQNPGKVAYNDPNYQTLVGLNNDVFAKKDNLPRPPAVGGKVPHNDPNYQTLAGLKNEEIFQQKQNMPAPRSPAQNRGKAAYNDPEYQTLAGLNQDIFGADKKLY